MVTGLFVGAVGTVLLAALPALARAARWSRTDAALLAALVPVALYAVRPYLGSSAIGAGDSHHYALQVADFIAQDRAGVRPILVGGSDFQFNGGVHTVRTAPYFTHLAGLLDLATLRALTAVQLQNLVVATTAVLAALAAYLAALHASGRRRGIAWALAALYVLSPGIYGPLTLLDMFATYMAAPALVLAWFGVVKLTERADDASAHLIAAGAVGLLWYAHSPIAAWFSLIWAFAVGVDLLRPGPGRRWPRAIGAGALLATLAAYAWVSLATLEVGPTPTIDPPFPEFSWARWQAEVTEALRPYAAGRPFALQLGLALWLLLAAGLGTLLWRRRRAAVLAVPIAAALLLLFPWPFAAEWLWRALPQALVAQMTWPAQRVYPLLASAAIVLAAAAFRDTRMPRLQAGALLAGGLWSLWQVSLLHARPGVAAIPPAVHAQLFSPDNLPLMRYSYAFFGRLPDTFTHSWTDPEFELRLLDEAGAPVTDNFRAVLDATAAGDFAPIRIESILTLEGPRDYLVEFAFASPEVRGEVVVVAPGIRRPFTLPSSGASRAFGAGPGAPKATPLSLRAPGPNTVVVVATEPGVAYRIVPYDRDALPLRLRSNIPLQVNVRSPAQAWLETPRLWIDGYAGTVDGRTVPLRKSPQGLVSVPVPAGESAVVLSYPGAWPLRAAWYLSLASLALWPWLVLRAARLRR